jgi:hypothetical protein
VRSIPAILQAYGFDEPKAAQHQLRRSSSWSARPEQSGYFESPQDKRPSCGNACSLIVRAKAVSKRQKTFCISSPWFFHFAAWRCSRITRS